MAARPLAATALSAWCWMALLAFLVSAQAQSVSPPTNDPRSGEPWAVTIRNPTVTNPGSTNLTVQVNLQHSSRPTSRRLTDAVDTAPIGTPPDPRPCPSAHRLLIKMNEQGGAGRRLQSDETLGIKAWQELQNVGIHVAELGCDAASQAKSILGKLRSQYGDDIEFAELDTLVNISIAAPNDIYWSLQWGPARTKVPAAWDRIAALGSTPRPTVVAVIDTGVRYDHEDLVRQMWRNPGEIAGNGIDDDGNGFIDDVYGYDFHNNDADPMDDQGHGTHCAGIVAATADNGKGVAGIAGRLADVKIMALKFLGANGMGWNSNALRALDYAMMLGVPVSSNSYGSLQAPWQSFQAAVARAKAQGHLFVVAAGNDGINIDTSSQAVFPCSYTDTLCVAATESTDTVASYSNRGPLKIQIAAPGTQIASTYFRSTSDYVYISGTSMATPSVAGAAALIYSNFKQLNGSQIGQLIQDSAEKTSWLAGVVATGGILDVAKLEQLAELWATTKTATTTTTRTSTTTATASTTGSTTTTTTATTRMPTTTTTRTTAAAAAATTTAAATTRRPTTTTATSTVGFVEPVSPSASRRLEPLPTDTSGSRVFSPSGWEGGASTGLVAGTVSVASVVVFTLSAGLTIRAHHKKRGDLPDIEATSYKFGDTESTGWMCA